jgi:hypothetical protein
MALETPINEETGKRDQDHVHPVLLHLGVPFVDALDELCEVNKRSRREIVEMLVAEAHDELQHDSSARITPL